MLNIKIIGGSLSQWDLNRQVELASDAQIDEVHFAKSGDKSALVVIPVDGVANIPNIHLQNARNLIVYAVGNDRTIGFAVFGVSARAKPEDYIYTETETLTFRALEAQMAEMSERITGLETSGGGGSGISPILSVNAIAGGHRITITDVEGTKTFDVMDGEDGQPGANGKSAYQYAVEGGYTGTEAEFAAKLAEELPDTLPNPNALTFTGAVTGTYDGTAAVTVDIPSGGGGTTGGGETLAACAGYNA